MECIKRIVIHHLQFNCISGFWRWVYPEIASEEQWTILPYSSYHEHLNLSYLPNYNCSRLLPSCNIPSLSAYQSIHQGLRFLSLISKGFILCLHGFILFLRCQNDGLLHRQNYQWKHWCIIHCYIICLWIYNTVVSNQVHIFVSS